MYDDTGVSNNEPTHDATGCDVTPNCIMEQIKAYKWGSTKDPTQFGLALWTNIAPQTDFIWDQPTKIPDSDFYWYGHYYCENWSKKLHKVAQLVVFLHFLNYDDINNYWKSKNKYCWASEMELPLITLDENIDQQYT